MQRIIPALLLTAIVAMPSLPAKAADAETPPQQRWSFAGPVGTFDRAQLQRGALFMRRLIEWASEA